MATFRPSIKENDSYVQKIIKYIPAEIITGYIALVGYLTVNSNSDIPAYFKTYYLILLGILVLITPIWTYYAVLDNESVANPDDKAWNKKRAIFHSIIAFLAFLIWVNAVGNPLLKGILCDCTNTNCADCGVYSPPLDSIILVLFTIMTPLLDRIILETKLP